MTHRILVFYGSYRSDRMGIRLADFVIAGLKQLGHEVELIDAKEVGLPMLDRMYKEYPKGQAPQAMEKLAGKIRAADGFIFITGEYNWGIQPGLKNLTDHFLEEWFWRPAAIASYSAGRLSGVRSGTAWHGTLSEIGLALRMGRHVVTLGSWRIESEHRLAGPRLHRTRTPSEAAEVALRLAKDGPAEVGSG